MTARTPGEVQVAGLVRVQLRSGHHAASPHDKALIAGWKKDNPGRRVGCFGPPTYGATQIAMQRDQGGVHRGSGKVTTGVHVSPQGEEGEDQELDPRRDVPLLDKTNDPLNAKFYIFQIQSNGSYKLVG